MKIELLYFGGCPTWKDGLANLKAALKAEGLTADVHLVEIRDDSDAARLAFLGSPSFRVDGMDLWHEEREQYNISCRVYPTPGGMKGAPTVEMLRSELRKLVLT